MLVINNVMILTLCHSYYHGLVCNNNLQDNFRVNPELVDITILSLWSCNINSSTPTTTCAYEASIVVINHDIHFHDVDVENIIVNMINGTPH